MGKTGTDRLLLATQMLLAGWVIAAFHVAWEFSRQPLVTQRAGGHDVAWLPVTLPETAPSPWGAGVAGPAAAIAEAEALLNSWSLTLMLLVALVGGLGYVAMSGSDAVGRRQEARIRRAVGARRGRLLADRALHSVGILLPAFLIALIALAVMHAIADPWRDDALIPGPAFALTSESLLLALGGGLAWTLYSFGVVQSGEMLPGRPLHARTPLGAPDPGEICHPAVPILQVAGSSALVISTGILASLWSEGADMVEEPQHAEPSVVHTILAVPPGRWEPLARTLVLGSGDGRDRMAVASAGAHEGLGSVHFARTECGRCFHPGSPPVPAPYKGEDAVHHGIDPATQRLLGIRVLEGRGLRHRDIEGSDRVALVSAGFARRNFEDGGAVGRRVRVGGRAGHWHTVVGVIEALPRSSLPARQQPTEDVLVPVHHLPTGILEVRASADSHWSAELPGDDIMLLARAEPTRRSANLNEWVEGYRLSWSAWSAGAIALGLLGVGATVWRRVWEERRELGIHLAAGAMRGPLAIRYLWMGVRWGAVGAAVGCWFALFTVAGLKPELFFEPSALLRSLALTAAAFTATTGLAAAVAALAALRGTPREVISG